MSDAEVRSVRSFCRLCTAVCGIVVEVDGDEVVQVRGDRENPLSRGYTCPKGRALPRVHHHPDRLEHPMMRIGDELQAVSWDECLDDLAAKLRPIIDEHGPSSVGIYFGSGLGMDAAGYRMEQALHRAIGTRAKFSPLTIDGTAKALVSHLVGGFVGLSAHVDFEAAPMVVFVGINPVVSHGHGSAVPDPVTTIRSMRERGAQVWVLDPRVTETARLADRHVAPRPGTDYAVLAHLVRELLVDGADLAILEGRSRGVKELAAAVEPFTLEHTVALSGVQQDHLRQFVDAARRAGPVSIHTGTGVTMAPGANVAAWLAWVVPIITGAMNRPGGMWFHPGFANQLESLDLPVAPPDALFGPGPPSRPETQSFLGEWPCAAIPDEIRAGNMKAFLNLGGNLVTAFPDFHETVPALQSLEVFATIEIIANETTAISTHVLPTKDQLEREDLTLWDFITPRVAAMHTPAVVDPVGDRRSAWWVLAELGRRLGHDLGDPDRSDAEVLATTLSRGRATYEQVAAAGYLEVPNDVPARWVEDHLDRIGGWQLAPPILVEQLSALLPPPVLSLVPRRQVRRLNSTLGFLGEQVEVLVNPEDAAVAGVVDGQAVVVRTARGEITGTAKVDAAIRPGAVSVPHGHEAANVNVLTDKDELDLVTGMVQYAAIPVTLHPAPLLPHDPRRSITREPFS